MPQSIYALKRAPHSLHSFSHSTANDYLVWPVCIWLDWSLPKLHHVQVKERECDEHAAQPNQSETYSENVWRTTEKKPNEHWERAEARLNSLNEIIKQVDDWCKGEAAKSMRKHMLWLEVGDLHAHYSRACSMHITQPNPSTIADLATGCFALLTANISCMCFCFSIVIFALMELK